MEDEVYEIERPIKVFVKRNHEQEIVEINSEIFIDDLTGWEFFDEGYGDKFALAQSHYLGSSICDESGKYLYK